MADTRVDKSWQHRGLKDFSLESILGTLRHYGVVTDEADFKRLAAEKFPLGIAEHWHAAWKGTGQFSHFPAAAADELWRRLTSDKLTPLAAAEAVRDVMTALGQMMKGSPDAPVGKAFARLDELKAKVPLDGASPRRDFVLELAALLGQGMEAFNQLAVALASEGHVEDAEAFAGIEEFLFPERAGVAKAMVRAARGEKAESVADLQRLAEDGARGAEGRLTAVDALLSLDSFEPAAKVSEAFLDEVEKSKDYHLAFEVLQRLGFALQKLGKKSELRKLETRAEALTQAHQAAHPEHE